MCSVIERYIPVILVSVAWAKKQTITSRIIMATMSIPVQKQTKILMFSS